MKPTPDIERVKYSLNLIYVFTAATLLYKARSEAAERNRISRNEAAKRAAWDAEEIANYRGKLWFEAHARHSFYESADGKISLRARNEGNTFAARNTKKPCKPEPEGINLRCGGTKFGAASYSSGAPYRRSGTA